MKDLIFITAFCPTEEQEIVLEKCVDSVLQCGKDIALISHSHTPIHIQKKCQYYFYDHLNDISDDYNFLAHHHFMFNGKRIQSRFFHKYFYGFAIYRMFSIASQIGSNFGYDNIHHIEYDCELLDKNIITEHSERLKEYDSVICTDNGKEDGFLFGSLKSFKVKSLPDNFKNYNRNFIENEMKKREPKQLEHFTKDLFINSGKVYFQHVPSQNRFKQGSNFYNRNLHYTLFYNPIDFTLNIFYNSFKDVEEEIVVMVNKEKMVTIQVQPTHWHIRPLGVFDDINHIRIDNSNKIIYQKSFDKELRDVFKVKSYLIIDEENN
jgi:hypothetical protein